MIAIGVPVGPHKNAALDCKAKQTTHGPDLRETETIPSPTSYAVDSSSEGRPAQQADRFSYERHQSPHHIFQVTYSPFPPSYHCAFPYRQVPRRDPLNEAVNEVFSSIQQVCNSVLSGAQLFLRENQEALTRGAKILAGATIVAFCAGYVPPLVLSITQIATSVLAQNLALFFNISKVALCALGVVYGLSLLFSSHPQEPLFSQKAFPYRL